MRNARRFNHIIISDIAKLRRQNITDISTNEDIKNSTTAQEQAIDGHNDKKQYNK